MGAQNETIRRQAGDLIARHLVAYHNACDWLDQSERAALLAKDVVSLHREDLSPAALEAIDAISMEDILDGGPTGEWGIRMTATARINALVKTEDRDTQRWRLRGVIAGLIVLWPSGPHRTDLQTILDLINPADPSKQ